MSRKCVVANFKSGYKSAQEEEKNGKVLLFNVPKEEEMLQQWKNTIPRKDYLLKLGNAVCEKHFLPSEIIKIRSVNYPQGVLMSSDYNLGEEWLSSGITRENAYPCKEISFRQKFLGDRFIPFRKSLNTDAFNFQLGEKLNKMENKNELKVSDQMKSLTADWRKRIMNQKMMETNVFPGLQQQQVLKLHEMKTDTCNKFANRIEGSNNTCWECRPRKRPLIGFSNKGCDDSSSDYQPFPQVFRFPFIIRGKHLVDWGKKNYIVMAVDDSVGVFDADVPSTLTCERYDNDGFVTSVKWSNDGTSFAIGRTDSTVSMKSIRMRNRILWSRLCPCREIPCCEIIGICWSSTDKIVIAGCSSGRLTNLAAKTGKKENTEDCEIEIIHFALSSNDKFLAVSLQDKTVKIYSWPDFEPHMNIHYYKRIKALAWHPWNNKILCIGGGHRDGSLSVWNVNAQKPLQYRRIDFAGTVENLSFNKLTGELVVHWSYLEQDQRQVKIVILASLDKIVDFFPLEKQTKILNLIWNPDNTRMGLTFADTLIIWDVFGREKTLVKKERNHKFSKFMDITSVINSGPDLVPKGFDDYNIR